jgi:uncharacterized repeat protein (TIGR02059 family)
LIPAGYQCFGIGIRVDATDISTITENLLGAPNVVTSYSWEGVATLLAGDFIILENPITQFALANASDSVWCYCENFLGQIIAPKLLTAVIANAYSTLLVMTFDRTLNTGSVPATSVSTVLVGGASRSVSSVAVSGATCTLTLASGVTAGQVVTVAYTKPTTNLLRDLTTTGSVATFTAHSVTNNVA